MTNNDNNVAAAIAEQEEHIKRQLSCQGVVGQAHTFRDHGRPGDGGSIHAALWSQCIVCGVTETREDYAKRLRARVS